MFGFCNKLSCAYEKDNASQTQINFSISRILVTKNRSGKNVDRRVTRTN